MRRRKHVVLGCGNESSLLFCIISPEHKNNRFFAAVENGYNAVGKYLPPLAAMASGGTATNSKHAVEKQHAVIRPIVKTAVGRGNKADIIAQFLIYVF